MGKFKLTDEQLGRLLYKVRTEPRRGAKRFLKDLGGDGSADELDAMLEVAKANKAAQDIADRIQKEREAAAKVVDVGVDGRVAEMLAAIRIAMDEQGLTQADIAKVCGWAQPLVSAYLTGRKEPGAKNLAAMASAVNCRWSLTREAE